MEIKYTTGYAGTGKSTALLKLLDSLPPETSVCLAPTHKALHRLANSTDSVIELKTIHSLLGWIPGINEEAEKIEHIDVTVKLDRPIDDYKNIVIDEAGMMSEDMLFAIVAGLEELNDFDTDGITLHLFLDPYQLLPVKGIQIQTDPTATTNLTVQHRAESPDVVAAFTKYVKYLEGINSNDLTINPSENIKFNVDLNKFEPGERLLAFTNKAVGYYNEKIANNLGISSYINQEVQLGNMSEPVETYSYVEPTVEDLVKLYENGALQLQNSQINKKFLEASMYAMITHKAIKFVDSAIGIVAVVEGIGKAYEIRKKAREEAIEDRKLFKHVYALGRAFTMDYPFASTVHKAQGSEFDTVWIDQSDLKKSIFQGNYNTYARLMYVALSRAKKRVNLLTL